MVLSEILVCVFMYIYKEIKGIRSPRALKSLWMYKHQNNYMINITRVFQATPWKRALRAARRTVGKPDLDKEPSDGWKARMLLAEHSPIRLVEFDVSIEGIRQWVTVH